MNNHRSATWLLVLAGACAPALGQEVPAIFLPVEGLAKPALPPEHIPVRGVRLDEDVLRSARVGGRFEMLLEDGMTATCVVQRVERRGEHVRVVSGHIDRVPHSQFNIVTYDDATAMSVELPTIRRSYRMHFMGAGNYQVCLVDETKAEPCAGGMVPPPSVPRPKDDNEDDVVEEYPNGRVETNDVGGGCTQSTPIFDIWVLYTVAARDAMGGTSAIRAEAVLATENQNTAYANSNITARARLVQCTETSYTEGADLNQDLDRLTGTSDGYIDGIHTTRDNINADIVTMYVNHGSGLGWCISDHDSAFSVVKWSRAAATYSQAHEMGHNLGCAHDRANADCGPAYDYGYGYTWTGNDSNTYSSVMSYGAGRVMHFSNPNVMFMGAATGVVTSSPNSAYNALVINNRDTTVANFELTRWDIYVDTTYGGPLFLGTYSNPANTFAMGVAYVDDGNTGDADIPNLYVRNNDTAFTGTVSKVMTITPCGGAVTIGNP